MTPDFLRLLPHPEGGSYRETWRGQSHSSADRTGGGSLLLSLGGTSDSPALTSTVELGPSGVLQQLVEPGQWQAAAPSADQADLSGCVVVPGFDFADFEIADFELET